LLSQLFLERPIKVIEDSALHRKILKRGFLATTIYSILYGIYEYFVVYNGPTLVNHLGAEINWAIMYIGVIITVALATKFSIQNTIMGLFYMAMFEDVIFWMCEWGATGLYPYPAGNWWDSYFASYRVLGGWGQAIPFWPFVPFYYLPGFSMVIIYYLIAYRSATYGRATAWFIGPLFLAIIGGTLVDDLTATYFLIFIPAVLLFYVFALTFREYLRLKEKVNIT
jgi:hypothetical protein